ncbi:MAG TPA: DUF6351 family protein [Rhizomicrobium sp.]|nr:DUF6351 family protein [Rhizomicrobium sp.]
MKITSAILAAALAVTAIPAAQAAVLDIKTLSSRPERVSGGDVLVQISQSDDAPAAVTLNGADVSKAFLPGPAPHTREGLVSGLKLGANILEAGGKSLTLTDYPLAGPIVSGPHETPFICVTQKFPIFGGVTKPSLADKTVYGATPDKDCMAPARISYLYLAKGASDLRPLADPLKPPGDIAGTTTTSGVKMNFIVRLETSTIDRGIYQSTVLYDPKADAALSWRSPPKGWNRRLVTIEGAGCPGGWYFQGLAGGSLAQPTFDASIFSVARLGEGDALVNNTLQNPSQSCNSVLSGEAATMSREHFIKTIGVPEVAVSIGCSGGSYGSSQLADAMPGFFDGVMISCTFPDPVAIAFSGLDGHLLTHYFYKTAPGRFTEAQKVAVSGYQGTKAWMDAANQAQRTDPVPGRVDIKGYNSAVWSDEVPAALRYDPKTNPKGARPTIFDVSRNIYGMDPKTGFALRTFDNVGVQYGLAALNDGTITPAQFLDLNEGIGGYDNDANYIPDRVAGDAAALKRAYQAGLVLSGGGGLASIPVVDVSGIMRDEAGYHYQWYHFAMRDRMAEANGGSQNHVMWRGKEVPFDKAWSGFISWVEAVHKDGSGKSRRAKAIADKPAQMADGCWTSPTQFVKEKQVFGHEPNTPCNKAFPSWANPRYIAGGPLAANVLKCQLRPVDAKGYKVSFSPEQLARLKKIFSGGVCDFSKKGVGQVAVVPWASFGPSPVNLVYDAARSG